MHDADAPGQSGGPTTLERMVFFSDAVVAIAITLLALELPVPAGNADADMWRHLVESRGEYITFLISFAVVGAQWLAHNRLLVDVDRSGGRLPQWNLLWLLTIVTTPFVTKVLTADGAFTSRFITYATVQLFSGLFLWLMLHEIVRHGLLREGATSRSLSLIRWRLATMMAAFLLSIGFATFTHWAYLCWLVVPAVGRWLHRLMARLPGRPQRGGAELPT